ncbi:MAG: type II toxin-antitoxin system VapC family toxin [Acidobacteria bacterium]|nr:type II toxin-antitoxin system VapC family toxin [Acidobacteriota bacterium]
MIVLDASAAIELVLDTEAGEAVARRIADPGESLHAPHLIDLEVAQALRRYSREGQVSHARARHALEDFGDLDVERYPHHDLLPRIWELRGGVTAYDAAYLALAEALRAPLLTLDARLARARGHSARLELVASRNRRAGRSQEP